MIKCRNMTVNLKASMALEALAKNNRSCQENFLLLYAPIALMNLFQKVGIFQLLTKNKFHSINPSLYVGSSLVDGGEGTGSPSALVIVRIYSHTEEVHRRTDGHRYNYRHATSILRKAPVCW